MLTQPVDDGIDIGSVAAEGMEEAEPALDDGRRPGEPVLGQVRCDDAGVGSPPAVHPLDRAPGSVRLEQPAPMLAAMPIASVMPFASRPRSIAALTAAPMARRWTWRAGRGRRDGVAELPVVATHAEAHRHLDADSRGVEQPPTARARCFRGREGAGTTEAEGAGPTAGGCRRSPASVRGCR